MAERSGRVSESGEHGHVDREIGLRVEVPAEAARPSGRTRELSVGVVEHRLHLEQDGSGDQVSARDRERGAKARDGVREHDGRRPDAKRQEREHHQVRQRPEDRIRQELPRP